MDFGYEMSASAVFREIGEKVPAYSGMRYPLLKDETIRFRRNTGCSSDVTRRESQFEIALKPSDTARR
jgi:hypothetical protein